MSNEHSQPEEAAERPQQQPLEVPNLRMIYTIGSGGMNAEQFFSLLTGKGLEGRGDEKLILIDTRRSTEYTRARFSHGGDLPYLCRLHSVSYAHHLELAPTQAMREELKSKHELPKNSPEKQWAWTRFLQSYVQLLGRGNAVLREGSPLRQIVEGEYTALAFLCGCQHPDDCHRQATAGLVAKWIAGASIQHLTADMVGGRAPTRKSPRRYILEEIPGANLLPNVTGSRRSS